MKALFVWIHSFYLCPRIIGDKSKFLNIKELFNDYKMKILGDKCAFLHSSVGRICLLAIRKTTNHLPIDGVFV